MTGQEDPAPDHPAKRARKQRPGKAQPWDNPQAPTAATVEAAGEPSVAPGASGDTGGDLAGGREADQLSAAPTVSEADPVDATAPGPVLDAEPLVLRHGMDERADLTTEAPETEAPDTEAPDTEAPDTGGPAIAPEAAPEGWPPEIAAPDLPPPPPAGAMPDDPGPDNPATAGAGADSPEMPQSPLTNSADDAAAPRRDDPPVARPESAAQAVAAAPPVVPARSGGGASLLALVAGGAIAAVLGFAAARYVVPEGWPGMTPAVPLADRVAALDARIATQDRTLADLQGAAGADPRLDAAMADLEAARAAQAALADRLATLEPALVSLSARLADLESRPAAEAADPEDLRTLRTELEALRTRVETQTGPDLEAHVAALAAAAEAERAALEARATALQAESEAAARAAAQASVARGALMRLQALVDQGGSLAPAIEELAAVGITVPGALSAHVDGVPTQQSLIETYPEAARLALASAIRVAPDAGLTDRLGAFVLRHTGARSLTPRDGDDPDAILSRAEAALRAGDLVAAISGLDALPDDARTAMSGWRARAETRAAALAALAEMAAGLSGN